MYLSELKIKGYKVFNAEFTVKINNGLTVLIGENGCGKTAIIDSIRLLLDEDEFVESESRNHTFTDQLTSQPEKAVLRVLKLRGLSLH